MKKTNEQDFADEIKDFEFMMGECLNEYWFDLTELEKTRYLDEIIQSQIQQRELETWIWIKDNLIEGNSDYYPTVMANIKRLGGDKGMNCPSQENPCMCECHRTAYWEGINYIGECQECKMGRHKPSNPQE